MFTSVRAHHRLRFEGGRFVRAANAGHAVPDERKVVLVGPDPIRVLLFGGEYALGYNARTRQEALDGAVADLLHERTGRGVIVHNRSAPGVRLDGLIDSVGSAGSHLMDLVIWCPTYGECVRRPFAGSWHRALGGLIRFLRSTSDSAIVLLTFPVVLGHQPMAHLARARGRMFGRAVERAAAGHSRVWAVAPPPVSLDQIHALDGARTYREAARELLPVLVEALDHEPAHAPSGSARSPSSRVWIAAP